MKYKSLIIPTRLCAFCFLPLCVLIFSLPIQAETALSYLDYGWQARSVGMGSAFTAVAKDSDAVYWNPANLALTTGQESTNLEVGLLGFKAFETNYSGVQARWSFAGFGLGFNYLSALMPDIKLTQQNPLNMRYEIINSNAQWGSQVLMFGLGKTLWQIDEHCFIKSGATLKMLQESSGAYKGTGVGLDFGLAVRPFAGLTIGLNVNNAVPIAMTWDTPSQNVDTFEPRSKLGLMLELPFDSIAVVDAVLGNKQSTALNYGLELNSSGLIPLRAGQDENGTRSLGIGLNLSYLVLDVSWSRYKYEELSDTYRYALHFKLAKY